MPRYTNLPLAARQAAALTAELLSPFNHGEVTPAAIGYLQGILAALNLAHITVSDNAVAVAERSNTPFTPTQPTKGA